MFYAYFVLLLVLCALYNVLNKWGTGYKAFNTITLNKSIIIKKNSQSIRPTDLLPELEKLERI